MNGPLRIDQLVHSDGRSTQDIAKLCQVMARSYKKLLGKDLVPPHDDGTIVADRIFQHNAVVLAHNIFADPQFIFANQTAMNLWEMSWNEIVGMPSRLSAEPDFRQDREHLLERVRQFGYIDNYSGIRISKSGKRFLIENAVVWNLYGDNEERIGQAATFSHWKPIEEKSS
jgi:hypothetical protein